MAEIEKLSNECDELQTKLAKYREVNAENTQFLGLALTLSGQREHLENKALLLVTEKGSLLEAIKSVRRGYGLLGNGMCKRYSMEM